MLRRTATQRCGLFCIVLAVIALLPLGSGNSLADEKAAEAKSASFLAAAMRVQPKRWDKAHNFHLLTNFATEAAQKGAKLVVTCEGFLDGYTGNVKFTPGLTHEKYLQIGEPIDGPWMNRIAALASDLKVYLAVGFAERRGQEMYNSVAVFSPVGELVLHYSKTHTKGETYNKPGTHFPVAEFKWDDGSVVGS